VGAPVLAYKRSQPFACEWYCHISSCRGTGLSDEALLKVNREIIQQAVKRRHTHKGYMAEYKHAKALVDRANETGQEPLFGSWF